MMKRASIAVLAAMLTTACMPLEQAALVYSSKNQMGVGLAAGTPDSPGLDVTIGYKGLDTAFVPVAIAKNCKLQGAQTCGTINYDIKTVNGISNESGLSEINELALETVNADLDQKKHELDAISADLGAKGQDLTDFRALDTDRSTRDKLEERDKGATASPTPLTVESATADVALSTSEPTPVPQPLSAPERSKLGILNARINRLEKFTEAGLLADIKQLTADSAAKSSAINDRLIERDRILRERRETRGDDKTDALSVYGSFGGNATGDSKGAGLKLGKVFSTGVAAQHVSQGIRNASRLTAAAECMARAKELITDAASSADRTAALQACAVKDYGE